MNLYQWKRFKSNQKKLIYRIQSNEITGFINEYYLIDDKTFETYFNNTIDLNYTYDDYIDYRFHPEIIYDISSAIKALKNYKKLKLVKKDLMKSICDLNYLRYYKTVSFYCGNNKLIIEFVGKFTNNALLIVNPLDSIIDNSIYSFVIAFRTLNNCKENLYVSLLNNDNINLNKNEVKNLQNNNIIINKNFDEYIEDINDMFPIEENGIPDNCFNFVIDNILIFSFNLLFLLSKVFSLDFNSSTSKTFTCPISSFFLSFINYFKNQGKIFYILIIYIIIILIIRIIF